MSNKLRRSQRKRRIQVQPSLFNPLGVAPPLSPFASTLPGIATPAPTASTPGTPAATAPDKQPSTDLTLEPLTPNDDAPNPDLSNPQPEGILQDASPAEPVPSTAQPKPKPAPRAMQTAVTQANPNSRTRASPSEPADTQAPTATPDDTAQKQATPRGDEEKKSELMTQKKSDLEQLYGRVFSTKLWETLAVTISGKWRNELNTIMAKRKKIVCKAEEVVITQITAFRLSARSVAANKFAAGDWTKLIIVV